MGSTRLLPSRRSRTQARRLHTDRATEPEEVTRREVEINLVAPILGTRLAMQRMLPRRQGHIVNVASGAGRVPLPGSASYSASKHGVVGLTESLRYNLAPHGIACALCCPALTRTSAWDSALKRPAAYAESGFGPVDETALRQFGTAFEAGMDPDEVGRKIVAGLVRGDGLILTHPEFADDFREIYEESLAALPEEEAPPARLEIERLRRAAMAQARAGIAVGLADLT